MQRIVRAKPRLKFSNLLNLMLFFVLEMKSLLNLRQYAMNHLEINETHNKEYECF